MLLSLGTPVYAYEFSDENAPEDFLLPVTFPYAAAHASEIQFIYDSFDRTAPPLSPSEQQLAATMVRYWTSFAANGDPNAAGAHSGRRTSPPSTISSRSSRRSRSCSSLSREHKTLFWTALAASTALATTKHTKTYVTLDAARGAARAMRPSATRRLLP